MVTYQNISITLRSQYDALSLPEFAPPPGSLPVTPPLRVGGDSPSKSLGDEETAPQISVFVPIYPSSMFWIDYVVEPQKPIPAYFFFKLFINGAFFVSWGVGKEDNYRGKTMHGLFRKTKGAELEKRSLFFSGRTTDTPSLTNLEEVSTDVQGEGAEMELRVYRASGRRASSVHTNVFKQSRFNRRRAREVDPLGIGVLDGSAPRRYYDWALIDPPERPHATFKYFFRIWVSKEVQGP